MTADLSPIDQEWRLWYEHGRGFDITTADSVHIVGRNRLPDNSDTERLAHLLHAAPDMLRALEGIRDLLDQIDAQGSHVTSVREAIRKAKGEAN